MSLKLVNPAHKKRKQAMLLRFFLLSLLSYELQILLSRPCYSVAATKLANEKRSQIRGHARPLYCVKVLYLFTVARLQHSKGSSSSFLNPKPKHYPGVTPPKATMALSAPLAVRDDISIFFSSIDDYYNYYRVFSSTCDLQCEENYWNAFVNGTKCGGNKTNFLCFCAPGLLPTDTVNSLNATQNACAQKTCSDKDYKDLHSATMLMDAFCKHVIEGSEYLNWTPSLVHRNNL